MAFNTQHIYMGNAALAPQPGDQYGQLAPGYYGNPLAGPAPTGPALYPYPTYHTQIYNDCQHRYSICPTQIQGMQNTRFDRPVDQNHHQDASLITPTRAETQANRHNLYAGHHNGHPNRQHPYPASSTRSQMCGHIQYPGFGHCTGYDDSQQIATAMFPRYHGTNQKMSEADRKTYWDLARTDISFNSQPYIPFFDQPLDEKIINSPYELDPQIKQHAWNFLYDEPPQVSSSASQTGFHPSKPLQIQNPSILSPNMEPSSSSMPSNSSIINQQVNAGHVHIHHNTSGGARSIGGVNCNQHSQARQSRQVHQKHQSCGNCQSCQNYQKRQSCQNDSDCRKASNLASDMEHQPPLDDTKGFDQGKKCKTPADDNAGRLPPAKKGEH